VSLSAKRVTGSLPARANFTARRMRVARGSVPEIAASSASVASAAENGVRNPSCPKLIPSTGRS